MGLEGNTGVLDASIRAMDRKIIAFTTFCLFANGLLHAQVPTWMWTHPFISGTGEGNAIKPGPQGGAYVGGQCTNGANFNGLISTGTAYDPFVGRVDENGHWLWVRRGTGYHMATVKGLDVASSGEVVIGGTFMDSLRLGTTQLVDSPGVVQPGGFVARLDGSGNWLWAKDLVSSGISTITDVALGPDGSVVSCGLFNDTLRVAGDTLLGGFGSIFLGKLDLGGDWIWFQQLHAGTINFDPAVDVDGAGNIALAGTYDQHTGFTLQDTLLPGASLWQGFLSMFDPGGNLRWARALACDGASFARAVTFDDAGGLYATGDFNGTVWLGDL
ncbi:MAG TPA: hypothetical protein VHL57_11815, partial [Flavobacteriales bacterium]|nr:hypothetical protein [Flavobacteriales bacterium]